MKDKDNSPDPFGIKGVSDAIKIGMDILNVLCKPAAEEFGLLFKDRVKYWRAINVKKILKKVEEKRKELKVPENSQVHPRLMKHIFDEGSWVDDNEIQDLWAGLLISSCSSDGSDDSNLIFAHLLSQITRIQARILNFSCQKVQKYKHSNGLIGCSFLLTDLESLKSITSEKDIQKLDLEMDHLRSLALITKGFGIAAKLAEVDITPTPLALQLFVRCNGSKESPLKFYNLE